MTDEKQLEYLLEERHERIDRVGMSHGWSQWQDASGYNNTNGGVYTRLSGLKSQITRLKRRYDNRGWPVEFRVFVRETVRPPWKEFKLDG